MNFLRPEMLRCIMASEIDLAKKFVIAAAMAN